MVYLKALPFPLNKADDDFLEVFFKFANTYTEESVLLSFNKVEAEQAKKVSADDLRELGYSDEDIICMEE